VAAEIARLTTRPTPYLPETLRTVLGEDPRELRISDLEYPEARTSLLHGIAGQIGYCKAAMKQYEYVDHNSIEGSTLEELVVLDKDWNRLFFDLLATGMNSHYIFCGQTPLITFVREHPYPSSWARNDQELSATRDWDPALQL
jgi:hypothetical protein